MAGLPSRTHASQGEQRSLALALRLGGHLLLGRELGSPPLLLLDDVFSELDADRSAALLASLPPGQGIVTTAGGLPAPAQPDLVVRVEGGKILP
jgi:DNA replication and repair protein RecF